MEKSNYFYKFLSLPSVYSFSQSIMSASSFRRRVVQNYINTKNKIKILDIGCGPAEILENFKRKKIDYYGFDTNRNYIEYAKNKYFEQKPKLYCKKFTTRDCNLIPKVDYVLLFGIIHHLKDKQINQLLSLCKKSLKKEGKLLVIEPVLLKNQNPIARLLIKLDRGSNVKSKKNYVKIFKKFFNKVFTRVTFQNFIPYTWFVIVCSKNN